MKKQLLLSLSFVMLLFFSCSKNESTKNTNSNSSKKVVIEDSKVKIETETELVSTQNTDDIQNVINKNGVVNQVNKTEVPDNIELLRKKHEEHLKNSPFKKVMNLSKKERKALGIPPNKYYEQEWELSINPETGKTHPENLIAIKKQLLEERNLALASGRTPGDGTDNNWVERGPNNVGGRVRAVMFDPNDPTFQRVFAGGVSGGLWKNTNITDVNTSWTRVNIPDNLAVSTITYDPNNTNIFYVGTGESYVGGDVNGDGVWKSTDGGTTWAKVFGGITGPTTFEAATVVTINSPAGVAGDYPCYPTTAFGPAVTSAITSDIVLVNDGTAAPTEGCNALTNGASVNGKIALIRRGNCTFIQKITNAQTAGAIAVIMMNNIPGQPVPMGGDDLSGSIVIPSVMISKEAGDALVAALGSGSVNGTLNPTTSGSFTGNLVPGKQHINKIKVRNNGGVSEIYVAAGDSFYSSANATTYLGGPGYGLYKSVDGGVTWSEVVLPLTANGNRHCPNDIEIGADNKIWVSTLNSVVYGDGGGKVFSSTDGNTFTLAHEVSGGQRTEIAVSTTNASKIYVLAEDGATNEPNIYLTTNGFTSISTLAEPASDGDISATDFCRSQAFYDLMIEVDPTNDAIVYIGGINLHRSINSGTSWTAISGWTTSVPSNVHSDQHGMAFKPGNSNIAIFGNDGGVYYGSNLSGAASSSSAIAARNKGLNITQFYSVGVAPTGATGGNLVGEYFAAGAQDNGTQYFAGVGAGVNSSVESQGGDGAFTMFDQGADKYYISNYVYNNSINYRSTAGVVRSINSESLNNGAFIAPMALDSSLDLLYTDYSTATPTYQIRRYKNLKTGTVQKTLLTNALLTSSPTALTVSKYTTTTTKLLVGTGLGKLLRVTVANPSTTATPSTTWTDITGSSFVGSISDVEYGASENEIFVTMHNYNVTSVWYSSDAGVTWQNKEGNLPDLPVKCILQNPLNSNEVIIGTELGVWYTNNFGSTSPTWNQSYNGMSNVKVVDLDLRNDNTVFAATYGRGVFSGTFTAVSLSNEDVALNKTIKVYPNPSKDILNVSIPSYSGELKLSLFDVNGREVLSNSENFSVEKSVNLKGLQSGIYILKLEGEGFSHSEKIVLEQ